MELTGELDSAAYPTIEAAAIAAISAVTHPFGLTEQAGLVVQKDGGYYYTEPVEAGSNGGTLRLHYDGKLVAIYHTHPKSAAVYPSEYWWLDYFSKEDVQQANRLGVQSFIGIEPCHCIRRFDPNPVVNYQVLGTYISRIP